MPLTIVMYHYVRRIAQSRFPNIKGLERAAFEEQLQYIKRFYVPVTAQQVVRAVRGEDVLPRNAIWLTFDDGYIDHFTHVFPVLCREGIAGTFFPPALCVTEGAVLDVNKIHFILDAVEDKSQIAQVIDDTVEAARSDGSAGMDLHPVDHYRAQYAIANRFDSAEIIYIKRMLQVALPADLRAKIVKDLFARFVSADEAAFGRELYMDEDQIRCLIDGGMSIGSHGYSHVWLNHLDAALQAREVDMSLDFLGRVGAGRDNWIMCYPYGGWDESLLSLLRARGCAMGVTTNVALADYRKCDPLLLPRLDTNDLPKSAAAAPVTWTLEVST